MISPGLAKIHNAVLRRVRSLGLPADAKILDAPCGAGELSIDLAREGWEVSGGDIVDELGDEARHVLGGRFRVADLNGALPWPDATFDLIVSIEGIEHLENAFSFVRELHRVCRPGGMLVLTTPNILSLRSRVRFVGSGFYGRDPRPLNESARHPLHHVGLRGFHDWRYVLQTSGFRLIAVEHTHIKPISYPYAIFAPWAWLYTGIAFRKEKDPAQRERNREIRRALCSASVLFGENLLLVAKKS
jgi:SAM-dependent methyltransferase